MHTSGAFVGTVHQARGQQPLKARIDLYIHLEYTLILVSEKRKKAMWIVELWQPDYRVVRGVTR